MAAFISFIIPVFNGEMHLSRCLDSLLSIPFESTELILVDDGSSDGSADIIAEYSQRSAKLLTVRQKNCGPSAARNKGLALAQGIYVAFIDCDDYIDADALGKALHQLERETEPVDIRVSDFFWVLENGSICNRIFQIEETVEPIRDQEYLTTFFRTSKAYWNVWRYIFRRKFLLDHTLYFLEGYHCAEDLEFMTRVFLVGGNYSFYHLPYYYYVVEQPGTLSRICTLERLTHVIQMIAVSVEQLCQKKDQTVTKPMLDKLLVEYIFNMAMCWELPKKDRKEAEKLFSSQIEWLKCSGRWEYHIIYRAVWIFGISAVSYTLFLLKKCKRAGKRWYIWMLRKIGVGHGNKR